MSKKQNSPCWNLEFDAPNFCDFTNLEEFENADVDAYFEVDHDTGARVSTIIGSITETGAPPGTSAVPARPKESGRKAPKNIMMGVQTMLKSGERAAALRDMTNSLTAGTSRPRPPLKRTNVVGSRDEPCAKQLRSRSQNQSQTALDQQPTAKDDQQRAVEQDQQGTTALGQQPMVEEDQQQAVGQEQQEPAASDQPPPERQGAGAAAVVAQRRPASPAGSRLRTPRGRSVAAGPRRSPRLAADGRRRSVSVGVGPAPPLPPRRPTPAAVRQRTQSSDQTRTAAAGRATPTAGAASAPRAPTPVPAPLRRANVVADEAAPRRAPSGGGRRRSMSQNDAARVTRSSAAATKLVLTETPNVLRRGLERRLAARSAAERAVKMEQQERVNKLRKQMADYKKAAAEAKKQPMRPLALSSRPTTVPQPFKLHDDGGARPAGEFKSMAQMIEGFYRKTPPRFHSRRAGAGPDRTADAPSPRVTVAHTPELTTGARTRSLNRPPSREQLEEAELAEARQHQVRAHPVNRRVLEQTVGVPAKQARPATRAEPFHLTEMPAKPTEGAPEPAAATEFRARPAPRRTLEDTQGVPQRPAPSRTRPQSPAMHLKQLMSGRRQRGASAATPERGEHKTEPKHARAPTPSSERSDLGVPFLFKPTFTQAVPFSFEGRNKERQAEKERKIQQVLEEERRQREFRAQLLPSQSHCRLPERRVPAATRPQPFNLPGEQLMAAAADRRQRKLAEEEAHQRQAQQFHAKPCTVTRQVAFQPRPASRGPTETHSPLLHTDTRSQRRQSFERRQKQREAELQAQTEERRRQQELEEQQEVMRQRHDAVHRAQPVRQYRSMHVKPSDLPPTRPYSPKWACDASRASHRSE